MPVLTKDHASDQITKNEMGGTCGTHGEGMHIGFW